MITTKPGVLVTRVFRTLAEPRTRQPEVCSITATAPSALPGQMMRAIFEGGEGRGLLVGPPSHSACPLGRAYPLDCWCRVRGYRLQRPDPRDASDDRSVGAPDA